MAFRGHHQVSGAGLRKGEVEDNVWSMASVGILGFLVEALDRASSDVRVVNVERKAGEEDSLIRHRQS